MNALELLPLIERVDMETRGLEGIQRDAARGIALARMLLIRSQELITPQERRQQAELDRMIGHDEDKATLVEMTDQAFRTPVPQRVADQLTHILDVQGVPRFFSPLDRSLLRGFQTFGGYLPGVAVPLVKDKMRRETANVILPAEKEHLQQHLRQRNEQGIRTNVNFLGEALLGEREARRRLKKYLAALQVPEIECISVKISTIYSQISALAREHATDVIAERMELLYRAAMREKFVQHDGTSTEKFVYLDMEEYRDLYITVDVLKRVLDLPELQSARAGIALQAYIPDSLLVLEDLARWARDRVERGGTPLTIRVVKGANMEMERVEASLGGWPQTPYQEKLDTDANYKKMLQVILASENSESLRLGVASHNLFDISLAALWAADSQQLHRVQFEMLEGMANHQRRALFELTGSMLLYAPACDQQDFLNAIGYLIRRLDENTGEENFLRHSFRLQPDSPEWKALADGFEQSLENMQRVSRQPRRQQRRGQESEPRESAAHWTQYVNEPDTDWALPDNGFWAEKHLAAWKDRCGDAATEIPLFIGQQDRSADKPRVESSDPSRPGTIVARFPLADSEDVRAAVECAHQDPSRWRDRTAQERTERLRAAAELMRVRRGDLIAAALADGGKTVVESDPEVSEAIDFAEFYALAATEIEESSRLKTRGRGTIAVVSPWNFPLAIPCGGVAAALAAGNTVILKPATDTVLPAYLICKCFWDAGVPREALQLVPCRGNGPGAQLIQDPKVDMVVLTGGTETAQAMLASRPGLRLSAETGGKNATIVSSMCDRDLAIKHVLHSAFGHAGQKCSATSLMLVEEEVYEDQSFQDALADAVQSLIVGSAWDLKTRMGPLIRPPSGHLARGLKELESGESWLVMPESVSGNPNLYRPGVKWNVSEGSFTHCTELFGPVLGVMKYRRLEAAIHMVNATGFGLTSGLESLDDREQQLWKQSIRAGNLYINRPTTGAIVLRQPFGGMGKSAFGPGVKAGGPNYPLTMMEVEDSEVAREPETKADPNQRAEIVDGLASLQRRLGQGQTYPNLDLPLLQQAIASYASWARDEYLRTHDHVKLVGQDNLLRYLPVSLLRIRLSHHDHPNDIIRCLAAAHAVGCRTTISLSDAMDSQLLEFIEYLTEEWAARIELLEESTDQLCKAIDDEHVQRLRMFPSSGAHPDVVAAADRNNIHLCHEPVVNWGRVELLHYVTEQSISNDYHRYGNLGRRGDEPRADVL